MRLLFPRFGARVLALSVPPPLCTSFGSGRCSEGLGLPLGDGVHFGIEIGGIEQKRQMIKGPRPNQDAQIRQSEDEQVPATPPPVVQAVIERVVGIDHQRVPVVGDQIMSKQTPPGHHHPAPVQNGSVPPQQRGDGHRRPGNASVDELERDGLPNEQVVIVRGPIQGEVGRAHEIVFESRLQELVGGEHVFDHLTAHPRSEEDGDVLAQDHEQCSRATLGVAARVNVESRVSEGTGPDVAVDEAYVDEVEDPVHVLHGFEVVFDWIHVEEQPVGKGDAETSGQTVGDARP